MLILLIAAGVIVTLALIAFYLLVRNNRKKCGDCMNWGTVACIYPDHRALSKWHKVCHRYSPGKTERW